MKMVLFKIVHKLSSCANGYDVLKLMCMVCLRTVLREFIHLQFRNYRRNNIQSLGGDMLYLNKKNSISSNLVFKG